MNPKLHAGLQSLCALYYSGEISEEEWALLQIHMAYCGPCHARFRFLSLASASDHTSSGILLIGSDSVMGTGG